MINYITTIWQGSDNEGSLSLTVSFLLAPFNNGKLTFHAHARIVNIWNSLPDYVSISNPM